MILGIGLDVAAVGRIAQSLAAGDGQFEAIVFTKAEREAWGSRADREQVIAARFAAKEACVKALGTGWAQGISYHQVEIICREDGRPELRLTGRAAERAQALGVRRLHVTLSHELDVAAAVVILDG